MRFLARLLPSQDVDALLGDIAEESRRRWRIWRWYQLLAIVVVASWRVVRAHPLLTLRAIGVGIAALIASVFALLSILGAVGEMLRYLESGVLIGGHWLRVRWPNVFFDGRWFHVPWPNTWPQDTFITILRLLILTSCAASGWIVRRLHRAHGIALVIPFAVSVPLLLVLSVLILSLMVTPAPPAPPGTVTRPLFDMVDTFAMTASILLGGCLDQRA
jgi:hypothetical protein